MATQPENPRAFPKTLDADEIQFSSPQHGMDLRDYFAAKALGGFTSCALEDGDPIMGAADTAKAAYNYADAMLAERAKIGTPA